MEVMRLHQHKMKQQMAYLRIQDGKKHLVVAKDNLSGTSTDTKDTSCSNLEKGAGGGGRANSGCLSKKDLNESPDSVSA